MTWLLGLSLLLLPLTAAGQGGNKQNSSQPQQDDGEFRPRSARTTVGRAETIRRHTSEVRAAQQESKKPETKPERREQIQNTIASHVAQVDAIDSENTGPQADPELKSEAAAFALQTGDVAKASSRAQEAVVLAEAGQDPNLIASALKTRALTYAAQGDNQKANADAKRVLEIAPKDEQAWMIERLTGRHVKEKKLDMTTAGKPEEGPPPVLADLIAQVRESAPITRPAGFAGSVEFTKQAGSAMKLGDWEEVHRKATLAIRKLPNNPKAYADRATALINMGRLDEAVEDATKGLAIKPNSPALLSVRAAAHNEAGRGKEALADATKALEINPKHALAWLQKGLAREKLGEPDDQYLQDFKTAAELDPDLEAEYAMALTRRHGPGIVDDHGSETSPAQRWAAVAAGAAGLGLLGGILVLLRRRKSEAASAAVAGEGAIVGGQFKLGPMIGSGGMGHVYEAWDTNLERPVAIKRLTETLRADPQEAETLIREAKTVAALKHPSIVAIYDAFKEGGEVYLVFELVKGETLYDHIQRRGGRLSKDEALTLLAPICSALDYAHERRVIHRDLKPTNVMLEDGHVKVMDFGIARRTTSEELVTVTNRVVGTPPFMAPEQQSGHVSRESDLYALAICAYHMLSGRLPFEGDAAHGHKLLGKHTPLGERLPGAAPAVEAVFAKALAPERADRYHSAAEFLKALRAALG